MRANGTGGVQITGQAPREVVEALREDYAARLREAQERVRALHVDRAELMRELDGRLLEEERRE